MKPLVNIPACSKIQSHSHYFPQYVRTSLLEKLSHRWTHLYSCIENMKVYSFSIQKTFSSWSVDFGRNLLAFLGTFLGRGDDYDILTNEFDS